MRLRKIKKNGVVAPGLPASTPKQANDDIAPPGTDKAPQCPRCSAMTLWYESHVKRDNGRSKVVHSFHCPNCGEVVQIERPHKQALRVVS